jgi:FAD/FMN-containing dehydrogenase
MWRMSRRQRERLEKLKGWAGSIEGYGNAFSADELRQFQGKLHGQVVLPSDTSYHASRQLTNFAFQSFPLLIVYCELIQDVWECLAFARQHRLWVTTRSGGHSTAGYSVNDGMVIDTSRMNDIHVDAPARTVTVGPGTAFGTLNAKLAGYRLHMSTGGCGDVCVAGYMQGGGYGFTSRLFGIQCDQVLQMLVMLADGRVVRASADTNADLFWAMRGGTGNNFGVLLEVTYQLHDMPPLWGCVLRWPLDKAPEALALWQKDFMKSGAPDEFGYMAALANTGPDLTPELRMCVLWWGPEAEGRRQIKPLLASGASIVKQKVGSYNDLNEWLLENIPPCPDLAREDKQSTLIGRKLSLADWRRICRRFAESPNPWTAVVIEPYGGAINRQPRDHNAFVHRDADCDLFVDVFWMDPEQERQAREYLDDFMQLLDPLGNGESYQNYPRASQADWRQRYFGEQFPRLLAIKRKFDPDNFFRYGQSISPEPGQPWPRHNPRDEIVVEPWSPPAIAVAPAPATKAVAKTKRKGRP